MKSIDRFTTIPTTSGSRIKFNDEDEQLVPRIPPGTFCSDT